MQYRVFGYTDEDPCSELLLTTFHVLDEAVTWAKGNNMATAVVDSETEEVLYCWVDDSRGWEAGNRA